MNTRSVFGKLEFMVLCFMLFAFLFMFTAEDKKSASNLDEFFVDLNLSGTSWDGDEPVHSTGNDGPWCSFDQIDWGDIANAVSTYGSATIFVFAKSGDTWKDISNSINPYYNGNPIDDVTFIGVKSLLDSSYWPGYTPQPTEYPLIQANAACNVVEINGSEDIAFTNFNFKGYSNSNVVYVDSNSNRISFINCTLENHDSSHAVYSNISDNLKLNNCTITSCGADAAALYASSSDYFEIDSCKITKSDDGWSDVMLFSDCDNITIVDSEVQANEGCNSIIAIYHCEDGILRRNKLHTSSNSLYQCTYLACITGSNNMVFETNALYGYCQSSVIFDEDSNIGFEWNCNTINNLYTSGGHGYFGGRTSGNNLSSFRNNLVLASSSATAGYAIYIINAMSDWQPVSSDFFNHNCYYSSYTYSSNTYFGNYGSNDYSTILAWESSCNDNNSMKEDPQLVDYYHYNRDTSNVAPMKLGTNITGITMDIDKGLIPTVWNVSIGCDQYFIPVYTYCMIEIDESTTPPTIKIGSSSSMVDCPYAFFIAIEFYGASELEISNVYFTVGQYYCLTAPSIPISLSSSSGTALDFEFKDNIPQAGQYTDRVHIVYNFGYTTITDEFDIDGWGKIP